MKDDKKKRDRWFADGFDLAVISYEMGSFILVCIRGLFRFLTRLFD